MKFDTRLLKLPFVLLFKLGLNTLNLVVCYILYFWQNTFPLRKVNRNSHKKFNFQVQGFTDKLIKVTPKSSLSLIIEIISDILQILAGDCLEVQGNKTMAVELPTAGTLCKLLGTVLHVCRLTSISNACSGTINRQPYRIFKFLVQLCIITINAKQHRLLKKLRKYY